MTSYSKQDKGTLYYYYLSSYLMIIFYIITIINPAGLSRPVVDVNDYKRRNNRYYFVAF